MARRPLSWLVLVVSITTPGCTLLVPYPPDGEEICGNGVDDDFDTRLDCDDEPCLGTPACPEDDLDRCTDGVDGDGDGRTDFADATCWPVGVVTLERCASVLGGDVSSGEWGGNVTAVSDPTGERPTGVFSIGPSPDTGLPTGRSAVALGGALDGLRASVELYLPTPPPVPAITGATITLFDAGTFRHPSYAITILVGTLSTGEVSGFVASHAPTGFAQSDRVASFAPIEEWFTLDIAIDAGVITASVAGGPTATLALPPDFPPSRALTLGVTSGIVPGPDPGVEPPLVARTTLSREPWLRCTDAPAAGITPPIGIERDATSGLDFSQVGMPAVSDAIPGSLCGLMYVPVREYVGVDAVREMNGEWWTTATALPEASRNIALPNTEPPSDGLPYDTSGIAMAIDPATQRFHAAVTGRYTSPRIGMLEWDLLLVNGNALRCGSWLEAGIMEVVEIPGRQYLAAPPVRYAIVDGAHEITLVTAPAGVGPITNLDLRTLRSETGVPGTFELAGEGDDSLFRALDPTQSGHGYAYDQPRIRSIGARDLVATVRRWDGRIELWVQQGESWARVPGVELVPSGEEGSFDSDALIGAELVEDEATSAAWRGRLIYSGVYDTGGVFGAASGFGPARVTIRAPGSAP